MLRFLWSGFLGIVALVLLAAFGIFAYDKYKQPEMVASILKISASPQSMKVFDCESPFTTDVLTTCAISIDPKEFSSLLKGYEFVESATDGKSHSLFRTKIGPEFIMATDFIVHPTEFKYGGHVRIITNKKRDLAIVDLYIE